MNIYKRMKAFFLKNKVSSFEYDCVKTELYKTNKSLLMVCSVVTALLFFVFAVFSFIFRTSAIFENWISYALAFVVLAVIFAVCFFLPEKRERWATFLVYCFYGALGLFSIYSGIFENKNHAAVVYFVLEFGLPLVFVDKIHRMFIFSAVMTAVFCVLSVIFKNLEFWRIDIFYALIFYVISFFPGFYLTKIRVREFSLRQLIETERDADELTGLLNKSAFTRETKKNLAATKDGILIIFDLDSFKSINDTYGHFTGDNVLKTIGLCVRRIFRNSDVMGRFGGDEFVIFMTKTNLKDIAMMRCRQLLQLLNSTRIFPNDPANKMTIHASIGFAVFNEEEDFDSLFKRADEALYKAKNGGKNCVCSAS